jgi:hypothetical protein
MPYLTVGMGTENDAAIELHYRDHGLADGSFRQATAVRPYATSPGPVCTARCRTRATTFPRKLPRRRPCGPGTGGSSITIRRARCP